MEHELVARGGRHGSTTLHVAVGDTVEEGQPLAELGAGAAGGAAAADARRRDAGERARGPRRGRRAATR